MANAIKNIPFRALKPSDISDVQWREIIDAWQNGLSDREAAFRASKISGKLVTEARIKQLIAESEDVTFIRDCSHSEILSKAKLNIKKSVEAGNVSTSKWLLERKAPEEYSSKAAVAFEGAVASLSMAEKQEEMAAFMEQFGEKKENPPLEVGKMPKGATDIKGNPMEGGFDE